MSGNDREKSNEFGDLTSTATNKDYESLPTSSDAFSSVFSAPPPTTQDNTSFMFGPSPWKGDSNSSLFRLGASANESLQASSNTTTFGPPPPTQDNKSPSFGPSGLFSTTTPNNSLPASSNTAAFWPPPPTEGIKSPSFGPSGFFSTTTPNNSLPASSNADTFVPSLPTQDSESPPFVPSPFGGFCSATSPNKSLPASLNTATFGPPSPTQDNKSSPFRPSPFLCFASTTSTNGSIPTVFGPPPTQDNNSSLFGPSLLKVNANSSLYGQNPMKEDSNWNLKGSCSSFRCAPSDLVPQNTSSCSFIKTTPTTPSTPPAFHFSPQSLKCLSNIPKPPYQIFQLPLSAESYLGRGPSFTPKFHAGESNSLWGPQWGSRGKTYTPTPESDSFSGPQYQSISAMPFFQHKTHEELRWEDYQSQENYNKKRMFDSTPLTVLNQPRANLFPLVNIPALVLPFPGIFPSSIINHNYFNFQTAPNQGTESHLMNHGPFSFSTEYPGYVLAMPLPLYYVLPTYHTN